MDDSPISRKRQIITTLSVLLLIVVIVGGVTIAAQKGKSTNDMALTANTQPSTSSNSTATFNDGTYKATGSYQSPGGTESITVSVTLKNGTVTDTSATSGANDNEAAEYQSDFISAYKSKVLGQKISSIKLSRVSGSSLTSQGFNSAIQKIESEASA